MLNLRTVFAYRPHLGLVSLVTEAAVVRPLVWMRSHVFPHVSDGFKLFAALSAFVAPLADVRLHVFLQHVARQELLLTY